MILLILLFFSISTLSVYRSALVTPTFVYSTILFGWFLLFEYGLVTYNQFNYKTIVFIFLCFVLFSIGAKLNGVFKLSYFKISLPLFLSKNFFLILSSVVFLYLLSSVNFANFVEAAVEARNSLDVRGGGVDVVMSNFLYASAPIGYLYYLKTGDKKWLLPVFFTFLISFLNMSRALILVCLLWFFFINIVYYKRKLSFSLFKIPLVCVLFFVFMGYLRGSFAESNNLFTFMLYKSQHYITGSLAAFDFYFQSLENHSDTYFLSTFPALAKFISLFFDINVNYYKYEAVYTPEITNVFSIYRELHTDFGYFGSLFVMAVFGFISQWLHRLCVAGGEGDLKVLMYSLCLTFIAYSPFYPITFFIFVFFALFLFLFIKV